MDSVIDDILDEDRPISPETHKVLKDGLIEHMGTGRAWSTCCRINIPQYRRDKRNSHIRKAYALLDDSLSCQSRCNELAHLFDMHKYEFDQDGITDPDPAWSELKTEIFHALNSGATIPDVKQLENIVKPKFDGRVISCGTHESS